MSNLPELGPIFHPLRHMFPVRLIMSRVLVIVWCQGSFKHIFGNFIVFISCQWKNNIGLADKLFSRGHATQELAVSVGPSHFSLLPTRPRLRGSVYGLVFYQRWFDLWLACIYMVRIGRTCCWRYILINFGNYHMPEVVDIFYWLELHWVGITHCFIWRNTFSRNYQFWPIQQWIDHFGNSDTNPVWHRTVWPRPTVRNLTTPPCTWDDRRSRVHLGRVWMTEHILGWNEWLNRWLQTRGKLRNRIVGWTHPRAENLCHLPYT